MHAGMGCKKLGKDRGKKYAQVRPGRAFASLVHFCVATTGIRTLVVQEWPIQGEVLRSLLGLPYRRFSRSCKHNSERFDADDAPATDIMRLYLKPLTVGSQNREFPSCCTEYLQFPSSISPSTVTLPWSSRGASFAATFLGTWPTWILLMFNTWIAFLAPRSGKWTYAA